MMISNPTQCASLLAAGFLAFSLHIQAAPAPAQNWPEWRGPLGTGVAPEAEPPLKWSEQENVKWKIELPGSGSSTPIVWGDTVYLQAAIATGENRASTAAAEQPPAEQGNQNRRGRGGFGGGDKPTEIHQFVLVAIDRETGKLKWQKVAREEVPHEGHHRDHGYSSSSPVTDGHHILAYFGSRGLHCFDMEGNLQWSKDLGRMQTRMSFGEGSSPALHANIVVVNWDHEGEDFIAAFAVPTGRELWRQPRSESTTWATPLIVEHDGQAQVVTSATKKVRSYDLETGELIWESPGLTANVIPSPVAGEELVFVTSGFRGNALYAIRLGNKGDLTDSDAIAWSYDRATPYVPSPLLYQDRLYFFSNNNGIISSFNAQTGEPVIDAERVPGLQNVYASPVAANGYIYMVGRDGTTVVAKHSNELQVVATNELDEHIDASPAIAGNQIFLRGTRHLYCLAEE